MQTNNDIQIIEYILECGSVENDLKFKTTFDEIKNIVMDKFEVITGCKLYNKSNIIKDIQTIIEENETKLLNISIEAINKNLIPEITFNSMFKSNLDFTLVFKDDNIIILYKNNKVEYQNFTDIKTDLLANKLEYLPTISNLYIDNIFTVIEKLINKDISVKYHLTDIPTPYWNLFEIKCKKINSNILSQLEKCKDLENIITGKLYQIDDEFQNSNYLNNSEIDTILTNIQDKVIHTNVKENIKIDDSNKITELENYHRMEIMSYLNDAEVTFFLETLEFYDKTETTMQTTDEHEVIIYIKMQLDSIANATNKMLKYYLVNKLFNFIMRIKGFLIKHKKFRDAVTNKINELNDDIYIIQTIGLDFCKEVTCTFENCKKFIDEIEKSLNPLYNPKWNSLNQNYESEDEV